MDSPIERARLGTQLDRELAQGQISREQHAQDMQKLGAALPSAAVSTSAERLWAPSLRASSAETDTPKTQAPIRKPGLFFLGLRRERAAPAVGESGPGDPAGQAHARARHRAPRAGRLRRPVSELIDAHPRGVRPKRTQSGSSVDVSPKS
jgi:hypothetical protein